MNLTFLLLFILFHAGYGWPMQERPQLTSAFSEMICKDYAPTSLAKQGIHDVGMASMLLPLQKQTIAFNDLTSIAKGFAARNHHHGFVWGRCQTGQSWVASTPAPSKSLENLKQYCRKSSYDFAPSTISMPIKLITHTPPDKPGFLEATCWPKSPRWLGPIVWFLQPTQGAQFTAPHLTALSSEHHLSQWINALRQSLQLPALLLSSSLNKQAQSLLASPIIHHDLGELAKASTLIAGEGFQLVAENRVMGQTPSDWAKLLWNSPRHRQALLQQDISHIGYAIQRRQQALIVSILFAKKKKLRLSNKKEAIHAKF